MAALTSSTFSHPSYSTRYDVFLSFRGSDTRTNFTDHLYAALYEKGFLTFKDDVKLKTGRPISDLFKAIEQSRIAVVILSSNYASSGWCLEEIAKIVECMSESGLIVLPVFYNVEPSDVRHQTGSFERHFTDHEQKDRYSTQTVRNWRQALTQVASLSGFSVNDRPETKVIQEIVERIFTELNLDPERTLSTAVSADIVGIHSVEEIDVELGVGLDDIRVVGICGMQGIGKTTIAKIVFKRNCHEFEASSFIDNVGEVKKEQAFNLQTQLYRNLLNSEVTVKNILAVSSRLRNKRVLVVLDGVNELEEIEALAGKGGDELEARFAPGSRIIITTSNEKLLKDYGARIYNVERLTEAEALLLFSRKAFKKDDPVEEFSELSYKFVDYADGLPLALVVLGSSMYGRPLIEWTSQLGKLSTNNNFSSQPKIFDILRVSLDGLDDAEKEIFLDIACFFKGEDRCRLTKIFKSCGYEPDASIPILLEKSLVSMVGGRLWMHSLLQETGKQIVQAESRKIGEKSRLWIPTDTVPVLKNAKGTELVKGIFLSPAQQADVPLKSDPFSEMFKLRLLKIQNVIFSGCLAYDLSNELRLLEWDRFPSASLPSSFKPRNLVELYLPRSRIERLWDEISMPSLEMLVIMDLSDCEYLRATPNFNAVPMLEMLILKGCKTLDEVHPSIGVLQGLITLNLEGCECLTTLPHSMSLRSLRSFILSGCCKLQKLPEIGENMKQLSELHLDGTAIKDLPISIKNLTGLLVLNLKDCKNLSSLPDIICTLKSLQTLNLQNCSTLDIIPEKLGSLECLKVLDASRSGIRQVPASLLQLTNLEELSFDGCRDMPAARDSDSATSNSGLQLPLSFSGLSSLESLNLSNCSLCSLPDDIECLSLLKYLDLSGNDFESLPVGISQLSQLEVLGLNDCTNLKFLPLVPSIRSVSVEGCPFLGIEDDYVFTSATHGFTYILCKGEEERTLPMIPISEHHILREKLAKELENYIYRQKTFQTSVSLNETVEIPKWFRRSTASAIKIPLPPDLDGNNDNLMGLGVFFLCELHENLDANENPFEGARIMDSELVFISSSKQYRSHSSCHIYTNDEDPFERPLVHKLIDCSEGWPGVCLYWTYTPRVELAKRVNKGSIRAEVTDVKVIECGAGLVYFENVPKFIGCVLGAFGEDHMSIPKPEESTSMIQLLGPNFQKQKSTDEPELEAVQSARLELTPYFMEIEPCASRDHSSSTENVAQLNKKEKVQLLLGQLFKGGNAGHYDYGFILSLRVRTILPWFKHQSIGGNIAVPDTPPELCRDETWLGLSFYAAFNASPGSTFTCTCYLMTITGKCLVLLAAPCLAQDSPNCGSHRICIIHIPRARFPKQWNQCGLVFASFDILGPDGETEVDMCGVSVLYKQDLEGLIQTVTNCSIRSPPVYYGRDNNAAKTIPLVILESSLVDVAESRYRSLRKRGQSFPLQRSFSTIQEFSELCISIPTDTPFEERDSVIWWKRNLELLLRSFLRIPKLSITLILGEDDIFSLRSFDPYSSFSITFPQNEIPEWVSKHKYPSNSFALPLPPNFENDEDWIGVVACASFSVHPTPAEVHSYLDSDVYPELRCHFECCEDPDHDLFSCYFNEIGTGPHNKYMWLYRRSFIWLLYVPRQYFMDHWNLHHELVATFTSDSTHVVGVHRCGMRVLHKEDVEEFEQSTRDCITSLFDKENLIRRYVEDLSSAAFGLEISVDTDSKTDRKASTGGNANIVLLDQNLLVKRLVWTIVDTDSDTDSKTDREASAGGNANIIPLDDLDQNLLEFDRCLTYNSCFPPNEITNYLFEYEKYGAEISMTLPLNLDGDADWIGIAFFVSFSCPEDAVADLANNMSPGKSHRLSCYFETDIGSLQPLHEYCTTNSEFQWLHLGGFIWLSYIPRIWFGHQLKECSRLEASIVSGHEAFSVDQCGFKIVYQQDEGELKQIITFCMTSLSDYDKEKQEHVVDDQPCEAGTVIGSKGKEFDRVSRWKIWLISFLLFGVFFKHIFRLWV